MKFELMLRSRTDERRTIDERHEEFCRRLAKKGSIWGFVNVEVLPPPDIGGGLVTHVNLRKNLARGLTGRINYRFRGGLRDEARFDDYLLIEFNPDKNDYPGLIEKGFHDLLECFDPYYGHVGNFDLNSEDSGEKSKYDLRDQVFRLHQVTFLDRELCQRTFKKQPEKIASLLETKTHQVLLVNNGICIFLSSEAIPVKREKQAADNIKALLS